MIANLTAQPTTRHYSLGTADIGEPEIAAVVAVLRSGYVSPGKVQQAFEAAVAARHGKRYATLANSGQSALHLSLEAWKMKRSDMPGRFKRVLCPAVTYISTLHAVWNAGLEVELCDVDPQDFMLATASTYDEIVMPVSLFGKGWNGWPISRYMVADNCEAIGVTGNEDITDPICLSFYASHSITTGSGGMVLTDDPQIDSLVKRLANHGRAEASDLYMKAGTGKRFVFTDVGYSFKSSDINAALGLAQLDRLDGIIAKRQANGRRLIANLSDLDMLQLPDPTGHTFQMFPIVCREPHVKDRLTDYLQMQGVEWRDAMPITTQPIVIEKLGVKPGQFPVADHVANDGFYIGVHQGLDADDIDHLADIFHRFF